MCQRVGWNMPACYGGWRYGTGVHVVAYAEGLGERGSRLRSFRRFLAWLAGADPDILEEIRTERVKYEGIGTAVLTTGTMAALSFGFALHMALHAPLVVCIVIGILWGMAIMGVDRLLISTMNAQGTIRMTLVFAAMRLVLALLIGYVISTPLVLRIFQPEINAGLVQLRAEQDKTFAGSAGQTDRQNRINALQRQLDIQNEIVGQNGGDIGKDETDQALFKDENTLKQDTATYNYANTMVQCDLIGYQNGKGCLTMGPDNLPGASPGLYATNPPGWGTKMNTAAAQVQADKNALAAYEQQRLTHAKAQAQDLQTQLTTEKAQLTTASQQYNTGAGSGGLLDRLDALNLITKQRPTLQWAHYLVLALITTIECLPVIVKVITSFGGPGVYDLAVEKVAREEERHGAGAIADRVSRRRRASNIWEQEQFERYRRAQAKRQEIGDLQDDYRRELEKDKLANWFRREQGKIPRVRPASRLSGRVVDGNLVGPLPRLPTGPRPDGPSSGGSGSSPPSGGRYSPGYADPPSGGGVGTDDADGVAPTPGFEWDSDDVMAAAWNRQRQEDERSSLYRFNGDRFNGAAAGPAEPRPPVDDVHHVQVRPDGPVERDPSLLPAVREEASRHFPSSADVGDYPDDEGPSSASQSSYDWDGDG